MKSMRTRRGSLAASSNDGRRCIYGIAAEDWARTEFAALAADTGDSTWQQLLDGREFLRGAQGLAAGAVVIFDPLPDMTTLSVVEWLAKHRPDIGVIVVTQSPTVDNAVNCLKAGALDYIPAPLCKDNINAALSAAFEPPPERVSRGLALRQQWIAQRLSQRELQVLQELLDGLSNKAIGAKLAISERTVEVHRSRIMRRLEVDSFAQLVRMGVKAGLESA